MLMKLIPPADDLQQRVAALAELFTMPDFHEAVMATARQRRRDADQALEDATNSLNAIARRHGGIRAHDFDVLPDVVASRAAIEKAERQRSEASAEFAKQIKARDEAFRRELFARLKSAEPTLAEVVDLLTAATQPVVDWHIAASRRGIDVPMLLREVLAVQEGTRALQAIVNRFSD
jgi:hypothetical protein